jgi:LuxR family transcriptional regulator, maltose regulon positive regulatory protein
VHKLYRAPRHQKSEVDLHLRFGYGVLDAGRFCCREQWGFEGSLALRKPFEKRFHSALGDANWSAKTGRHEEREDGIAVKRFVVIGLRLVLALEEGHDRHGSRFGHEHVNRPRAVASRRPHPARVPVIEDLHLRDRHQSQVGNWGATIDGSQRGDDVPLGMQTSRVEGPCTVKCEPVLSRHERSGRADNAGDKAFEHAIKGSDPHLAADILNSCCSEMFYCGEVRALVDYADRLPEDVLRSYPLIELDLAWWLIVEWRFSEAERLLLAVRGRVQQIENNQSEATLAAPDLRKLKLLLAHRQMMLDLFKDDVLAVEAPCRVLTREYRDADPYVACSIYVSLIYAQRGRYRLNDLEDLDAAAREYHERLGNPFAIVWHQSVAGPARFLAGDPRGAIKGLEEGLQIAAQFHGISALASLPALPLSEIYYELNALSAAAELVERYLPMASEFGFVDQLIAGYTTKARLALLNGDEALAEATFRCALQVANRRGFDRLRSFTVAELMRMYALGGHVEKAGELAASQGLVGSRARLRPNGHTTLRDEALALAWVRFEVMEARCTDALAVANAWHDFARNAKATRSAIQWDVLRAKILLFSGDRRGAQRALRRAIATAAPGGYVRSLIDEGEGVAELLKEMHSADPEPQATIDAFIGDLLVAMGAAGKVILQQANSPSSFAVEDGINATLDAREREILSMVALGLLNREIGQRLGLTEGSVKWYLQRIFDKLGIRRRTQAVRRARRYGLLA